MFAFAKTMFEKTFIIDAFSLIWGMTITLMLFLLEVRETRWYGSTLKEIVSFAFSNGYLIFTAGIFIGICPVVYLSCAYGKNIIALYGISYTFFSFAALPLYIMYITRKNSIRELLICSSIKKLKNSVDNGKEKGHTLVKIETLPISSMIENIDYKNVSFQ